jgi:transposase-like protein
MRNSKKVKEFLSNQNLKNEAILLFRNTHSLSQVAKFLGFSTTFTSNWLKEVGEYKPHYSSYSSICLPYSKLLIEYYLSGYSCEKIGKIINFDAQAVRRLIKDMGILKDTKPYQKLLNHNWLDNIDTEEKSYFLGLLAADGWLDRNTLFIDLQKKDSYLLETLQQKIVPFIPLAYYSARATNLDDKVRLSITSKSWRMRCEELQIGYRKSLTMPDMIDKIPLEVRNHFVRGYFDGDGTVGVYFNKNLNKKFARVQFLGTKSFLVGIHRSIGLPVGTINLNPKEKIHRLNYSGKQRLFEIKEYLYKDATIFLPRKKNKFVW